MKVELSEEEARFERREGYCEGRKKGIIELVNDGYYTIEYGAEKMGLTVNDFKVLL